MKNKKFIALALAAIMLAGCGNKKKADTSKVKDTQPKTAQTETANQEEKTEETTAPQTNSGASEKKPTASSSSTSSSTSRKAETVKTTSNKPSTASSSKPSANTSNKPTGSVNKTSSPAKKPTQPSKPSKPNKPSKPAQKYTVTYHVYLKDRSTGKKYKMHSESATENDQMTANQKAYKAACQWADNHDDVFVKFADSHGIGSYNTIVTDD